MSPTMTRNISSSEMMSMRGTISTSTVVTLGFWTGIAPLLFRDLKPRTQRLSVDEAISLRRVHTVAEELTNDGGKRRQESGARKNKTPRCSAARRSLLNDQTLVGWRRAQRFLRL